LRLLLLLLLLNKLAAVLLLCSVRLWLRSAHPTASLEHQPTLLQHCYTLGNGLLLLLPLLLLQESLQDRACSSYG
jgi:hypothetical protein